jgi:hypothetical protein
MIVLFTFKLYYNLHILIYIINALRQLNPWPLYLMHQQRRPQSVLD